MIVYQASQVKALTRFFKATHMKDRTRQAAREQFEGLSKQVKGLSKTIEAEFRTRVLVKIDAPCFVVPFKQET